MIKSIERIVRRLLKIYQELEPFSITIEPRDGCQDGKGFMEGMMKGPKEGSQDMKWSSKDLPDPPDPLDQPPDEESCSILIIGIGIGSLLESETIREMLV